VLERVVQSYEGRLQLGEGERAAGFKAYLRLRRR
jgi:hypothetical protein